MKKLLMLVGVFAALSVFIYLSGCVIGPPEEASCAGMPLNRAMEIASQSDCMAEGALKAGMEMCNDVTKTWWLDLDVERAGCNPACVVDVEAESAEVNWRCTGLIVPDEGESLSYTDLPPAEAKGLIEENPEVIVIDVSPHYANGHLPGAVHYYLGDGSLDAAIPSLDPNAVYLVYCHVDSVARAGAQKLVDAGFSNVYRLEGNYSGWVSAGYEIER